MPGYQPGKPERNKDRLISWARSRYLDELITLEEYEREVERILRGSPPIKPKPPIRHRGIS